MIGNMIKYKTFNNWEVQINFADVGLLKVFVY